MDSLGRFYTQELYSTLLVNRLSTALPSTVVDLGVGDGSLIRAASKRWNQAKYIAADIDRKSVSSINRNLPFVKIFNANSLSTNIDKKLEISVGSVDVAICNPPYLQLKADKKFFDLFDQASLKDCIKLKCLTSDIIFLAQNIRLLKADGELGIILPDSLLTGHEFQLFRKSLVENHSIKSIIELPANIFPKTEAKTHILILEKSGNTSNQISLFKTDKDGSCVDAIDVCPSRLEKRMDYSFHKWNAGLSHKSQMKLSEITSDIRRGSLTHAELKQLEVPFIHTTNMLDKLEMSAKYNKIGNSNLATARKGDILVARVGRGCIGKVSLVRSGNILISDCVYRIRVPKVYRDKVWRVLKSQRGQEWFKANCHGVCAKVISKADLLNFLV